LLVGWWFKCLEMSNAELGLEKGDPHESVFGRRTKLSNLHSFEAAPNDRVRSTIIWQEEEPCMVLDKEGLRHFGRG